MTATIFQTDPLSGDYEEKYFGSTTAWATNIATLWVKFQADNFEEWAGAFPKGTHGITKLIVQGDFAFVVAVGQCYLLNYKTKKLIFTDDNYPFVESAIATVNPDLIVYSTFYGYKIVKNGQIIEEGRPEMVDGIEFIEQQEQILIGQLWEVSQDNFWNKVTLDLNTFQLTIDKSVVIDHSNKK